MKNTLKKFGFAVIITVIGLVALLTTGCPPADDGEKSIIEMVSIPAGTFTMGSPVTEPNRDSDETQHSVTLSRFKMSKYLVTQKQYQEVMGAGPLIWLINPQTEMIILLIL